MHKHLGFKLLQNSMTGLVYHINNKLFKKYTFFLSTLKCTKNLYLYLLEVLAYDPGSGETVGKFL